MSDFVYRQAAIKVFVYCIIEITIHKYLCGLQRVHKLFDGCEKNALDQFRGITKMIRLGEK